MSVFREVDPKASAITREESIMKYWQDNDVAEKSIEVRDGCPEFVFYEGPPTANGHPGIHHVLARTLKDLVCRYKTMQGYQVRRKAGWDTHGLPVELEVEKALGLSSKKDIESYGIKGFNERCRDSVLIYEKEWRRLTERIAYWLDMDHPYMTMTNDYVESVWWILDRFFKQGLIYEGHKILPYCPRCGTPLASHEVAQGYKDETIDSVYVKMKVKGKDNEYLLIWTTTPWTLPSNVSVTVNPDAVYVRASLGDEVYYLVKDRVREVLGPEAKVLEEFSGKSLEYLEYEQLLPFVVPEGKAFYVTCADYVLTEDGTGLVHTAPAFGEDDFATGQRYGLPVLQLVDEAGRFLPEVTDWAGEFVKKADPLIVKRLAKEGKVFQKVRMTHSYPHCWRCDTSLLYYARKSWHIATTKFKEKLIENNNKIKWYPPHVGSGRFGNWLENLVDWSLSRNRYWGTPLNIWKCEKCGKLESVGSRQDLAERAVEAVDPETVDLHRPYVDDIHFECSCGGLMTRTPEVIDCWFDSGAMPYAQWHYPFEHKDDFHTKFPADFICEGIDQTRGWFYSLLAISTMLFDEPAFKQVLVNDLILDKYGQKMSKSKGNAVEPWDMIEKFGADALRWYLVAVSPPWVPTKFDVDGVREVSLRFLGTLQNVYAFFTLYANIDGLDPREIHVPVEERPEIDRWIVSRLNTLCKAVETDMESFELTRAVRAIASFVVDDVSNWYVRRSRERFWSTQFDLDKRSAYRTLYEVLMTVAKLMAPFAPFMAEDIYLNLSGFGALPSVHFEHYPEGDASLIDEALENKMGLVIKLVGLGRAVRNKVSIKVRQPLGKMFVSGKCQNLLRGMEELVKEELNVKEVRYVDQLEHHVDYEIRANLPVAGPKFGKKLRSLVKALSDLDGAKVAQHMEKHGGFGILLDGEPVTLSPDDVDVRIHPKEGFAIEVEGDDFVVLDTEIDEVLSAEGIAREIVSKVQNMRKGQGFEVLDRIRLTVASDEDVKEALSRHKGYIEGDTLCEELVFLPGESFEPDSGFTQWDINGHRTFIKVEKFA